jgi:hypothetical protein
MTRFVHTTSPPDDLAAVLPREKLAAVLALGIRRKPTKSHPDAHDVVLYEARHDRDGHSRWCPLLTLDTVGTFYDAGQSANRFRVRNDIPVLPISEDLQKFALTIEAERAVEAQKRRNAHLDTPLRCANCGAQAKLLVPTQHGLVSPVPAWVGHCQSCADAWHETATVAVRHLPFLPLTPELRGQPDWAAIDPNADPFAI